MLTKTISPGPQFGPNKTRRELRQVLTANAGATVMTGGKLNLDPGQAMIGRLVAMAHDPTAGHHAYYELSFVAKNIAGTTSLVGAVTSHVAVEDDATWAVTVAANDTDDTVDITVTPDASNDTTFKVVVEYEVVSATP